jgi:hypothetical protein
LLLLFLLLLQQFFLLLLLLLHAPTLSLPFLPQNVITRTLLRIIIIICCFCCYCCSRHAGTSINLVTITASATPRLSKNNAAVLALARAGVHQPQLCASFKKTRENHTHTSPVAAS